MNYSKPHGNQQVLKGFYSKNILNLVDLISSLSRMQARAGETAGRVLDLSLSVSVTHHYWGYLAVILITPKAVAIEVLFLLP